MTTNGSVTLYHKMDEGYKREYLPDVWRYIQKAGVIDAGGLSTGNAMSNGDIMKLRIPDTSISVKKGDVVVDGDCERDIANLRDLRGIDYYVINTVAYNLYGNNQHIRAEAI